MFEAVNATPSDPRTLWLSRLAILFFACAMFVVTWASWPDLIFDCGRELYVPWAMLHGKLLYRDLWYPYGPLAPSVIALLLRIFGAHLNTFYGTGLAMLTASALVLHSIALRFVPPIAALVCTWVFLAEGFQPRSMNYIVPYSYGATFMCLLCMSVLLFLLRFLERKGLANLGAAGLCAGLASISKVEAILPCAAGIAAALILCAWRSENPVRTLRLAIAALLPGLLVSATVFIWLIAEFKLDFLVHGNWQSAPGSYFMQRYGSFWGTPSRASLHTNGDGGIGAALARCDTLLAGHRLAFLEETLAGHRRPGSAGRLSHASLSRSRSRCGTSAGRCRKHASIRPFVPARDVPDSHRFRGCRLCQGAGSPAVSVRPTAGHNCHGRDA